MQKERKKGSNSRRILVVFNAYFLRHNGFIFLNANQLMSDLFDFFDDLNLTEKWTIEDSRICTGWIFLA